MCSRLWNGAVRWWRPSVPGCAPSAQGGGNAASLAKLADAQKQAATQQKELAINLDLEAQQAEHAVRQKNGRLTAQAAKLRIANQRASALSSSLALQAQTEAGLATQNGLQAGRLAVQARTEAGLAAKNGLQAGRLAVQARTEAGLAAAQRHSAEEAHLELGFATKSISLGHNYATPKCFLRPRLFRSPSPGSHQPNEPNSPCRCGFQRAQARPRAGWRRRLHLGSGQSRAHVAELRDRDIRTDRQAREAQQRRGVQRGDRHPRDVARRGVAVPSEDGQWLSKEKPAYRDRRAAMPPSPVT
jgi:hypothetical protein